MKILEIAKEVIELNEKNKKLQERIDFLECLLKKALVRNDNEILTENIDISKIHDLLSNYEIRTINGLNIYLVTKEQACSGKSYFRVNKNLLKRFKIN